MGAPVLRSDKYAPSNHRRLHGFKSYNRTSNTMIIHSTSHLISLWRLPPCYVTKCCLCSSRGSRMMQWRGHRSGPKPEQNPIGEEHRSESVMPYRFSWAALSSCTTRHSSRYQMLHVKIKVMFGTLSIERLIECRASMPQTYQNLTAETQIRN
jgi:hypothetical protein